MNLVKWFRKNNTKVMAVVVIVLMVGFIGGSSLTMLLRGSGGADEVIGTFVGKGTITPRSRQDAKRPARTAPGPRRPSTPAQCRPPGACCSVSCCSREIAPRPKPSTWPSRLSNATDTASATSSCAIMYQARTVTTEVYWILLREETRAAGIHVSADQAGQVLGDILPQLSGGRDLPAGHERA